MAQEGIAAALTIPDDIMDKLKRAQTMVDNMAASAERMGEGFKAAATSMGSIANAFSGKNISAAFDTSKGVSQIEILSDATVKLNKSQSAAAQGARELDRALRMTEGRGMGSIKAKMEAIEKALAAPGVSAEKVSSARAKLEELRNTYNGLQTDAQESLNAIKAGLSTLDTSGNVEKMRARLKALQQTLRELKALEKQGFAIPVGSIQATQNAITALNQRISATNALMGITSKNANMVRGMLSAAFSPIMIASFLKNLVAVRGEFELAQKSLAVLIRSEGMAADMFEEISRIAVRSPFSVMEMTKQVKQLAAYRIENEKLISTTKMLGDISAGVGVDMNRLILAYGQVKAATFLKGQELRQFSEAGVNMLGGLAERFSDIYQRAVSTGEVLQMVSKRMVKFEDVDAVLRKQTAEGGTFYKMQEKQAETLKGMVVNLQDRIQLMFNQTGTQFDTLMKKVVKGIEWVISHGRLISGILIPLITMRVTTGLFGLVLEGRLVKGFSAVAKAVVAMNRELAAANALGVAFGTKAVAGVKAFASSLGAIGWGTVIGAVLAIGAAVAMWVSNARAFSKEIEGIITKAKATTEESVANFNRLVDKANDLTRTTKERLSAIEELKKQYGNILPIQDLELSNVNKLNDAREQQIELIKEQIKEEARADIIRASFKELNKKDEKRGDLIYSSLFGMGTKSSGLFGNKKVVTGFLEDYKKQVKGLGDTTIEEAEAIRKVIEEQIINGTITDASAARDKFFEMLLVRANASQEQIDSILSGFTADSYSDVTKAFESVAQAAEKIRGIGQELNFDISIPRELEKYRKEIQGISEVRKEFMENLSQEEKAKYETNPKQLELDIQKRIEEEKWRIEDLIASASTTEISETWKKKLNDMLSKAYREASDTNEIDMFVTRVIASVTDEFPNLIRPIGFGELFKKEDQSLGDYTAKLHSYSEEYRGMISSLNDFKRTLDEGGEPTLTEGELDAIFQVWSPSSLSGLRTAQEELRKTRKAIDDVRSAYDKAAKAGDDVAMADAVKEKARLDTQYRNQVQTSLNNWRSAIIESIRNLNEEADALDRAEAEIGKRVKKQKELNAELNERKKHEADLLKYGKDLIALSQRWDDMDETERGLFSGQMIDQAIDLNIDFPKDVHEDFSLKLGDLERWIEDVLKKKLGDKKVIPLDIEFSKASQAGLKKQQQEVEGIARDIIGAVQKQGKYTQDVLDGIIASLQERVDTFNARKDTTFTLTLPVKLGLPETKEWVNKIKEYFSQAGLTDILMLLQDQQNSANQDAANAAKQRKQDIKSLVNDVKSAIKQFDKLDDEGDELLRKKLDSAMDRLKIKKPLEYRKEEIDKWLESIKGELDKNDYYEIKITTHENDIADWIKSLSDRASALWDKYDNAKKLEGWGLSFVGASSSSIMRDLEAIESQLRAKNTEDSIAQANQIKEKRLQILRSEQEEAARIMYEAQKKSLSKTRQAYQTMYENIEKIRRGANKGENQFTPEQINAAVQSQIAKSMKEVADAEWDAYKSTEMYAMAFGDLEGLSKDVLETLKRQLVDFKGMGGLNPTEIQAIEKAIKRLDTQMASFDGPTTFYGQIKEAFKAAKDFRESVEEGEIASAKNDWMTDLQKYDVAKAELDELNRRRDNFGFDSVSAEEYADAVDRVSEAQKKASVSAARYNALVAAGKKGLADAKKKVENLSTAYSKIATEVGEVIGFVKEVTEAFGGELGPAAEAALDGIQSGFALTGSAISIANGAMEIYIMLTGAETVAMTELMATMWPLLVVAGALAATFAIIKAKDKSLEKQIEDSKYAVERLKVEYDELERSMNKAMDLRKSAQFHDQMVRNLNQQIAKLEEARALEEQRKSRNGKREKALDEFDDQINDINRSIHEANDEWLEFMGSFSDSRNEAKSWASNWLDAFKDAKSGVQSLSDSFDDMYEDIVTAQLADVLAPQIEQLKELISSAVKDGYVDEAEATAIMAQRQILSNMSDDLKKRAEELGIRVGGEGGANTLQKGIESVTEQTAQALESYLNSTRAYVADNNRILLQWDEQLMNQENENSILANIRTQTRYLRTLSSIAQAVYSPGSTGQGAGGIKVFVMG